MDIENNVTVPDSSLLIEGDKIVEVLNKPIANDSHINGCVVDMRGRYVLPGLCNMHNNLSMETPASRTDPNEFPAISVLRLYKNAYDGLLAGSTTLRLVGELNGVDIPLRNMINSGLVKGPRLICARRALGITGGHATPLGVDCDSPDEFRKAARTELLGGADFLKIFITGGIAKAEEGIRSSRCPKMT